MTIIALTLLLAAAAPCPGSTTREVEQCLADDLARANAELNRYYAAAVKRLTSERQPVALAKLRASEHRMQCGLGILGGRNDPGDVLDRMQGAANAGQDDGGLAELADLRGQHASAPAQAGEA